MAVNKRDHLAFILRKYAGSYRTYEIAEKLGRDYTYLRTLVQEEKIDMNLRPPEERIKWEEIVDEKGIPIPIEKWNDNYFDVDVLEDWLTANQGGRRGWRR